LGGWLKRPRLFLFSPRLRRLGLFHILIFSTVSSAAAAVCLYVICLTRMNKQGGDGQTRAHTISIDYSPPTPPTTIRTQHQQVRPSYIHTRDSLLFCLLFSLFRREGKKNKRKPTDKTVEPVVKTKRSSIQQEQRKTH
jgi:hypothetical protein